MSGHAPSRPQCQGLPAGSTVAPSGIVNCSGIPLDRDSTRGHPRLAIGPLMDPREGGGGGGGGGGGEREDAGIGLRRKKGESAGITRMEPLQSRDGNIPTDGYHRGVGGSHGGCLISGTGSSGRQQLAGDRDSWVGRLSRFAWGRPGSGQVAGESVARPSATDRRERPTRHAPGDTVWKTSRRRHSVSAQRACRHSAHVL